MKVSNSPRDGFAWLLDGMMELSDEFKGLVSWLKGPQPQRETVCTVDGWTLLDLIQSGIEIIARDGFSPKKTNCAASEFVDVVQAIGEIPPLQANHSSLIRALANRIFAMSYRCISEKEMREALRSIARMLRASRDGLELITEADYRYFGDFICYPCSTILSEVFEILRQYDLGSLPNFYAMQTLCKLHLVRVQEQLEQWVSSGKGVLTQTALEAIVSHARLSDFTLSAEDIKSEYRECLFRAGGFSKYRAKIGHDNSVIPEISERIIDQGYEKFLCLLDTLEHEISQYDSVLISIGPCGGQDEQHLPQYMTNRARSEKVLICLIDPAFLDGKNQFDDQFKDDLIALPSTIEGVEISQRWRYQSARQECDLSLEVFPCLVPCLARGNIGAYFGQLLEQGLIRALNYGTNVYIANHTQAYNLRDVPLIAKVYNKIKRTHSSSKLLQLYTQGGDRKYITYYDDLCYDKFSEFKCRDSDSLRLKVPAPSEHFYLATFPELENLDAFQMKPFCLHHFTACLRAKTQGTNSTHVLEMLNVLESDILSPQEKLEKIVRIARHANQPAVRLFANSHVVGKGRHKNIQMFYDRVQGLKNVEELLQLKACLKSGLAFTHPADKTAETSQAAQSQFFARSDAVPQAVVDTPPLPKPFPA